MTLTQPAQVVITATAVLGTTSSSGLLFDYEVCSRTPSGTGPVALLNPSNFLTVDPPGGVSTPYTDSLAGLFASGTYDFGLCVLNYGTATLDKNDWVNGTAVVYGPTS